MKRLFLVLILLALAVPAEAQSLQVDLAKFVETPAVTGREQALAKEIESRLAPRLGGLTDNMGNVWVTLGSGAPHRLIVTPMDEPGYVVSGITDDGYLRVQRLPQQAPHPLYDILHAAQPVVVGTRKGEVDLRRGRRAFHALANRAPRRTPRRASRRDVH